MTLGRLLGPWQLDPTVLAGVFVAAGAYAAGVRARPRWPRWRTVAFLVGLTVVAVALESGLDTNDDRLLSIHMVQHLALVDLAAPLLLLGEPVTLVLAALAPPSRGRVGRVLTRTARRLSPAGCLGGYVALLTVTHLPAVFAASLGLAWLHALVHGAFLLAGALVWWPVLGRPNPRRLGPIGHLLYLTVAMLPMTAFGAALGHAGRLLYPAYAAPARRLGISALADQAAAGTLMWVLSAVAMGLLGLLAVAAALLAAERRQQARELHGVAP